MSESMLISLLSVQGCFDALVVFQLEDVAFQLHCLIVDLGIHGILVEELLQSKWLLLMSISELVMLLCNRYGI